MTHAYAPDDLEARAFFDEHGYVVLTPQFSPDERARLSSALDVLLARFADEQGLALDAYLANISQWRDLWRLDEVFRGALGDARLWSTAAHFMGRKGARLLHDHVIMKPAHASGTVPWHQDYPYWPVDTAEGLSCWCPLEDVGPEGGCLEVIDGSHRWGESPPVDFLADDRGAFDTRADRVRLPVPAGSVVVLHSLTWHRTGSNREVGNRPAYISLWLPPDARYAPEHSRWHPVNEHVTVRPGEILDEDWFPLFGEREIRSNGPRPLAHEGPVSRDGLSMFDASTKIADQLRRILARAGHAGDLAGGIGRLLALEGAVTTIVRVTLSSGVAAPGGEEALRAALERLRIASEAYRLHRARNVYNGAYVEWWQVAGAAWDAELSRQPARAAEA
ncbi:phytanoyl-CoA dioxygenase family protein [Polyangium aurulentum]|uniref:phytanoyl-CoA dioxygenase family protein n=1 Tax=Polyangium aurulentum TaxID=2567896 RepID=UPI0010ADB617|nr:phytanoyl-CoA dioxygenase family protein [Polyangium aurulentum]UQA58616.1 phytanoyl-CoA dioxygenase family protein [Polyangium aurulentum]